MPSIRHGNNRKTARARARTHTHTHSPVCEYGDVTVLSYQGVYTDTDSYSKQAKYDN